MGSLSEHFICFAASDPDFVPDTAASAAAVAVLQRAWPHGQRVAVDVNDHVVLRDCGENLESVRCPHCAHELSVSEWHAFLDRDLDGVHGFRLESLELSCCGRRCRLSELRYDWDQAFSRFALTVSGSFGRVPPGLVAELEAALGSRVRVVYRML